MLFNTHTHTLYFSPSDSSLLSILFSFSPVFFVQTFLSSEPWDLWVGLGGTGVSVTGSLVSGCFVFRFPEQLFWISNPSKRKDFIEAESRTTTWSLSWVAHILLVVFSPMGCCSCLLHSGLFFWTEGRSFPLQVSRKVKGNYRFCCWQCLGLFIFLLLLFWLIPGWLVGRSFFLDPTAEGLRDLGMLHNLTQSPVPFS